MNAAEGLQRIATVIRWIGKGLLAILILSGIALAVFGNTHDSPGVGLVLAIAGAVCMTGCYAVAWIIDGQKAQRDAQLTDEDA